MEQISREWYSNFFFKIIIVYDITNGNNNNDDNFSFNQWPYGNWELT